jgi:hypothetical protein
MQGYVAITLLVILAQWNTQELYTEQRYEITQTLEVIDFALLCRFCKMGPR